MRKKPLTRAMLVLLALAALVCLYLAAGTVGLRAWTSWQVRKLESADRTEFSIAFGKLAYDSRPRVSLFLCDELERAPSRELYYHLARILYTRCGVHYAPEARELPGPEEFRRMVNERYGKLPDSRKP